MKACFKSKRPWVLLAAGVVLLAGVGLFFLLARLGYGIPCPLYTLTGFQCPGCGNSRAVVALLQLDFRGAISYNPLFPLEFFYIGWVLFFCSKSYLKGKPFAYHPPCPFMDILVLGLVVLWGIVRNLLT